MAAVSGAGAWCWLLRRDVIERFAGLVRVGAWLPKLSWRIAHWVKLASYQFSGLVNDGHVLHPVLVDDLDGYFDPFVG